MITDINITSHSDFAGTEKKESASAAALSFSPVPPITVESYIVTELDNYSGEAEMILSNGHFVKYRCVETSGYMGPDCHINVTVIDHMGREFKQHFPAGEIDEFLACDTIAQCMFEHYKKVFKIHNLS